MRPENSFSLECEQWRHDAANNYFSGEIFFDQGTTEIRGALECKIHAENLSSIAKKTVPVMITILKISAHERAEELIANLINRTV